MTGVQTCALPIFPSACVAKSTLIPDGLMDRWVDDILSGPNFKYPESCNDMVSRKASPIIVMCGSTLPNGDWDYKLYKFHSGANATGIRMLSLVDGPEVN